MASCGCTNYYDIIVVHCEFSVCSATVARPATILGLGVMDRFSERQKVITESARVIGINHLKPQQVRAMDSILNGTDTFVSLPTGYGKSVIFAALPLALTCS